MSWYQQNNSEMRLTKKIYKSCHLTVLTLHYVFAV